MDQPSHRSILSRLDLHDGPDNTLVASFELPGLKKEDVSIDLHNNRLTISGESKSSYDSHNGQNSEEPTFRVRERRFGKFSRSIALPEGTQVSLFSKFFA